MMSKRVAAACGLMLVLGVIGCDPPQNVNPPPLPKTPTAPPLETPKADTGDRPVPEGFTESPSGLRYKVIAQGSGKKPTTSDRITAKYRGWTDDGKEFDSGEIGPHPVTQLVAGWTEALQMMQEGGKMELEIPPALGYGPNPPPGSGIPPNAWLHFQMELVTVH